jgi:hypothetical protein
MARPLSRIARDCGDIGVLRAGAYPDDWLAIFNTETESVSAITSNNPIGFYGCQPVTPIRHLRAQNSGIARGKDWDVTCRHHNV